MDPALLLRCVLFLAPGTVLFPSARLPISHRGFSHATPRRFGSVPGAGSACSRQPLIGSTVGLEHLSSHPGGPDFAPRRPHTGARSWRVGSRWEKVQRSTLFDRGQPSSSRQLEGNVFQPDRESWFNAPPYHPAGGRVASGSPCWIVGSLFAVPVAPDRCDSRSCICANSQRTTAARRQRSHLGGYRHAANSSPRVKAAAPIGTLRHPRRTEYRRRSTAGNSGCSWLYRPSRTRIARPGTPRHPPTRRRLPRRRQSPGPWVDPQTSCSSSKAVGQ